MELTSDLLAGLVARASRPDFGRFESQLATSGFCSRPVRLVGHVDSCDASGQRRRWSTQDEPDGVLRKACGNRREVVCAPCAERYRYDAYQLIAAGMRDGKGVPDSVAEHPAVFVTLTAPSFGAVHTRRMSADGKPRRCRPRRDVPVCEHGTSLGCNELHAEDDPRLSEPICRECFDHRGAVVWNNALSELWRRTTIYLPRALARLTRVTQARVHHQVRVAYVRVVEYQRRGLVHLHVVIRLDRAMPKYRADEMKPPSERFTVELLEQAVRAAVAAVDAPVADRLGERVRWGSELGVDPIGAGGLHAGHCAGYLAKYATKSTELAGGVVHRVAERELDALPVREHVRTYMREAFRLAADPALAGLRFERYAHAIGYRGHSVSKSRRYSTTFKALRTARKEHVRAGLAGESPPVVRQSQLRYSGIGHDTDADAFLVRSAYERRRQARILAREALSEVEWSAA
jgi:hypothetical protein